MDLITKKKRVIANYLPGKAGVDHISAELHDLHPYRHQPDGAGIGSQTLGNPGL